MRGWRRGHGMPLGTVRPMDAVVMAADTYLIAVPVHLAAALVKAALRPEPLRAVETSR